MVVHIRIPRAFGGLDLEARVCKGWTQDFELQVFVSLLFLRWSYSDDEPCRYAVSVIDLQKDVFELGLGAEVSG